MTGLFEHAARGVLVLTLLAALAQASAQALVVNGNPVGEGVAFSVADTSYAAAAALAQAIGAQFFYDAERKEALFAMAGRLVSLRVYDSTAQAAADDDAMHVGGRDVASLGGVLRNGTVYVQVRALAAAFGGRIALIPETNTVAVFLPQVTLSRVTQPELSPDFDRVVLEFASDVPVVVREEAGAVVLSFLRARLVGRAERLSGRFFEAAAYYPAEDGVELRLELPEGSGYELLELSQGQGSQVIIDVFAAATPVPETPARRVVLDPAPQQAADDDAMGVALAQRVASALARRGLAVSVTRDAVTPTSLERRSAQGIGADLFVSLALQALPPGHVNLYYLDEASNLDSLDMAIRQNAEGALATPATDETRRRLLVGLVNDLAFGRSAASSLAGALRQRALEPGTVSGAPLFVLGGAAGRGLLIELSRESAMSPAVDATAEALAEALAALLP